MNVRARPLAVCCFGLAAACLDYGALTVGGDGPVTDLASQDLRGADFAGPDQGAPDLETSDLPLADFAVAADFTAPSADLLGPVCTGRPATCLNTTDVLFCDDFESGSLMKWGTPVILAPGSGSVGLSTTQVCRGTDALSVATNGGANLASLAANITGARSPAYVRAYVFFTNTPTGDTEILSFLDSTGAPAGAGVHAGNWAAMTTGVAQTSSVPVSAGRWYCVEVALDFLGSTMQISIDDAPAVNAITGTLSSPLSEIRAGLTVPGGSTQGAQTAYFDEIVFRNSYIPCYR
jgi:hypothetical protein